MKNVLNSGIKLLGVCAVSVALSGCETFDMSMLQNATQVLKMAADYKTERTALKSGLNNSSGSSGANYSAKAATGQDMRACMQLASISGVPQLRNNCGTTVQAVWRDTSSGGFNKTQTIAAGAAVQVTRETSLYGACRNANSVSTTGSSYTCR